MTTIDETPGAVFEQYASQVYAWAYRLLGRHHDALDVVQDVFLRWDAQCALAAPDRPCGWLRRVTVNRAIDVRRQRRAETDSHECFAPAEAAADVKDFDQDTLRADLIAALEHVSGSQRSVLFAKLFDDLTFQEIASELNLGVSTAKTHYLRALRTLRDRLAQRWNRENTP